MPYCPRSSMPADTLAWLVERFAHLRPRPRGGSGRQPLPLEVRLDAVGAVVLDGLSYRRAGRVVGRSESGCQFLQPLLVVFRHVEGHRHLWQPLARKGGAEVATRILRDHVTDLVREHLRSQFPALERNQPQLEAAVQFLASACMGLLIWWLDNEIPSSAEELYAIFRRLTTQGVRRFLTT